MIYARLIILVYVNKLGEYHNGIYRAPKCMLMGIAASLSTCFNQKSFVKNTIFNKTKVFNFIEKMR